MKVGERHDLALRSLQAHGEVSVAALSRETGVSEMTIRRDLETLERQGLLRRVHGGATNVVSRGYEPPFALRASRNGELKARIGERAAAMVSEGEALIIDVGTTPLELARALASRTGLTVLTPSLRAADLLSPNPELRVIVTGGIARAGEMSLVGDLAERAFADLRCDTVFLGAGGIDPDAGVTEFNLDDARVKRAALASARRCVVLADSAKLERIAVASVCPLERVDVLVTDDGASEQVLDRFREREIEVVIA
jgi:DeoR/GlpR family transcriptional regulator of sugar metabolism